MSADEVRIATASAYDHIVDDFVRRNDTVPADFAEFRATFVAAVRSAGGDGSRVVDLGCGPGRDAVHFLENALEVAGVDASRQMAMHARGDGVPVVQADLRFVPLRSESLDGIWSAASLLHVPRPEVPATLRGWSQLLRPTGVLGLSTSLGDDEGWETCPYDPSTQPADTQLRRWFVHHDDGALLELLDAAGFEVMSARERVSHRRWLQVLARVRGRGL
jgi:SAM-dependent methyltransferase